MTCKYTHISPGARDIAANIRRLSANNTQPFVAFEIYIKLIIQHTFAEEMLDAPSTHATLNALVSLFIADIVTRSIFLHVFFSLALTFFCAFQLLLFDSRLPKQKMKNLKANKEPLEKKN